MYLLLVGIERFQFFKITLHLLKYLITITNIIIQIIFHLCFRENSDLLLLLLFSTIYFIFIFRLNSFEKGKRLV